MICALVLQGVLFSGCTVPDAFGRETPSSTQSIVDDSRQAGERLEAKDVGERTQALQRKVLARLDALLRDAEKPPMGDASPNANKATTPKKAPGRELNNSIAQVQNLKPEMHPPGAAKIDPKWGKSMSMSDVYKDVWGHLPEQARQEMDLYFREQFMPRYSELLRDYYSSLAESAGKK